MTASRWYYPLHWLAVLILGLAIYGQTFNFAFVFDDNVFIVTNPYIKNFGNLPIIWTNFPMTRLVGMYSFALNYAVNQLHPEGYHIFNFMVHLAGTGLVWAVCSLLVRIVDGRKPQGLRRELPFVVALLFLVHPGQTQAVTYISQRFESMATVFSLGAFYWYLRGRISPGQGRAAFFALGGACAVMGILTKEVAVTIVPVILAAEWILFPGPRKTYGKYAAAAAGAVLIWLFMKIVRTQINVFSQTFPSESHDGDMITGGGYVLTQMRVFLTFMRLLVFPVNQNVEYDYPLSTGLLGPPLTLAGAAAIAGMAGAVVLLRRKNPLAAFGLAWVLATFSINLVPRANVIFEHKLYLISVGFFLAVVCGLWAAVKDRSLLLRLLAGMIAVLSVLSFMRNQVWKNELILWEDIARKSPGKARVNANLAHAYAVANRYEESVRFYTQAIALNPADERFYANRAVIYGEMGQTQRALEDYTKALSINPDVHGTYIKRAWLFRQQNNYPAAMADVNRAVNLEPYFPETYILRARFWTETGHNDKALEDFERAVKIAPYDYQALIGRGAMYYHARRYEEALADFDRARDMNPDKAEIYVNRAHCLIALGRNRQAQEDFETAKRLGGN